MPILQGFLVVPYWAMVRFGEWDEILADKGPRHETPFTRGAWRYARAMALTAKGRLDEAEQELGAARRRSSRDPALKGQTTFSTNTGARDSADRAGSGRRRDRGEAEGLGQRACCISIARSATRTRSIYQEPPDWHAPVRQNLGAVLLAAGRADEAEAVYWEDLRKNPGNGWALFGLLQALKAQGKNDDAALVEQRFRRRGRTPTSAHRVADRVMSTAGSRQSS